MSHKNNNIEQNNNINASIWSILFTPDEVKFLVLRDGLLCDRTFTADEIVKDTSLRNVFSSDDLMIIYFQLIQDKNKINSTNYS